MNTDEENLNIATDAFIGTQIEDYKSNMGSDATCDELYNYCDNDVYRYYLYPYMEQIK